MNYSTYINIYVMTHNKKKIYIAEDNHKVEINISNTLSKLSNEFSSIDIVFELLDVDEKGGNLMIKYWGLINYDNLMNHSKFKLLSGSNLGPSEKKAVSKLFHRIDHLSPYHLPRLLGKKFTINQLFQLYKLSNHDIDKGNFYKIIKNLDYIVETEEFLKDVNHRPPRLYKFKKNLKETPIIFPK